MSDNTTVKRLAVVPVRNGVLPTGSLEAISAAGGAALIVGSSVAETIDDVSPFSHDVTIAEFGSFAPAAWAKTLAPHLADCQVVVLPASPDGRDLAPRLAAELAWPLVAGAVGDIDVAVQVARHGGLVLETLQLTGPTVVTLVPGVTQPYEVGGDAELATLDFDDTLLDGRSSADSEPVPRLDTESLGVSEADAQSLDLSEARRIIAGGAGLVTEEAFAELAEAADAMDASLGGTRVVMDKGWIPFERQIGTTGIMVNPDLYISLGISGAVQHTAGLGEPSHIVAVNTDPHCPMMAMADLALVTDAPLFLREFLALLKQQ